MGIAQIKERPTGVRKENAKRIEVRHALERYRLRNVRVDRTTATVLFKNAAKALGASHGERTLMDLLFKRSQPQDWLAGKAIVWPSNETLAFEMDMTERGLQKMLSRMADKGWISHIDSPTGRRLGFRDENNQIAKAWGIDLTPLALMTAEMETIVEDQMIENQARRLQKANITTTRKRITGLVEYALRARGDDEVLHDALAIAIEDADMECLESRSTRKSSSQLQHHHEALLLIEERLEGILSLSRANDNVAENNSEELSEEYPNIDNEESISSPQHVSEDASITTLPTNTDKSDSCNKNIERSRRRQTNQPPPTKTRVASTHYLEFHDVNDGPTDPIPVPIDRIDPLSKTALIYSHFQHTNVTPYLIWETCLHFSEHCGDLKPSWRRLVDGAVKERHDLGINQSAWNEAIEEMSIFGAAAAVYVIAEMERQGALGLRDAIKSPGGYLRYMVKTMTLGMLPDLGPKLYGLRTNWQKAMDPTFNAKIQGNTFNGFDDDNDDLPF